MSTHSLNGDRATGLLEIEGSDPQSTRIEPGRQYLVASLQTPGEQARLLCDSVVQRNWSRVAAGRLLADEGSESTRVFIKQNIDKSGRRHPEHWQYEQAGILVAADLLKGVVRVPALQYQDQSLLLNVFEHVDVITMDELLRSDPAAFRGCFASVIQTMARALEAMKNPPAALLDDNIPVKTRSCGGPSTAINFKGLEVRNVALIKSADGAIDATEPVMFDFARPYLAPIEEAAAKLFVSIGLLNWGKPLGRFARGPDTGLLKSTLQVLRPYLDREAVAIELEQQSRLRTGETKGAGRLERSFKRLGVGVLGRRYLHQLRVWCERNVG